MKPAGVHIAFSLLMVLLIVPLIGHFYPFWNSVNLFGQNPYQRPEVKLSAVWKGDFQNDFSSWYNDHFFLREEMVRTSSQMSYSLFHESISKEVFIGKNNQLYHTSGTVEYSINDRWYSEVQTRLDALELFQNYLNERGKQMFVIIPPDKIRTRPEDLPDEYRHKTLKNAYYHYRNILPERDLHVIDLSDYLRNSSSIPAKSIFPKHGFHWNTWPAIEGFNKVLDEVQRSTGDTLPRMVIDRTELSTDPKHQDIDLWRSLNIFTSFDPEPVEVPFFHREGEKSDKKVLVISDSFYLTWLDSGVMDSVFADHEYWYYAEYVFRGKDDTNKIYTSTLDFKKHLEQFDYIFLMAHEPNLNAFPFGLEGMISKNLMDE